MYREQQEPSCPSPLDSLASPAAAAPQLNLQSSALSTQSSVLINPELGGFRELIHLAWPLVLSSSFWTIQLFLDAIFLSWYSQAAVGAAMSAALVFWTPFILLQVTANYATTFVAQYLGAGRKERVGPAIWQALYFAVATGLLFLGLRLAADDIFALVGHDPAVREMELTYFGCLCFCALPMLITASCNAFFAGRGESRVVLLVDAVGTLTNGTMGFFLIFGYFGLPQMGIAGAGWGMVIGSWVAAIVAFAMMMRAKYRTEFATLSGWRFEGALFRRLMRFGLPSGLQWCLDGLAFTVFVTVIGRIGTVELSASSIAHRINMLAFLPMLGVGQAVAVLVGQRLGQNKPDLAERSAKTGLKLAAIYMTIVAVLYVVTPGLFTAGFAIGANPEQWHVVEPLVRTLLIFIAVYSLFNSVELVYTFALRGAGDTVFVTWMSISLSWPFMVLPTVLLAWKQGWGLYWAWGFASFYIIAIAVVFMLRFRTGKWKSMRVIEQAPVAGISGQ
jgi:MATE family multidrug resistance protein